jgi:pimeloyl-ACP methyl ester carboxylesterase
MAAKSRLRAAGQAEEHCMTTRDLCVVVGTIAFTLLVACAANDVDSEPESIQVGHVSAPLSFRRQCKELPDDIYAPANGNLSGELGEVVRCAKGRRIPTEEISAALAARGFDGIVAQKAVKLFTITYRTQRRVGEPDLASALVALPARKDNANPSGDEDDEEDKTRDGRRTPLIVFAHGTAPYNTDCALSKLDPLQCSTTPEGDTELVSIVALATQGYAVVAPDYAGYIQGSRAPGYLLSEDEAHSVLDAARAMNKLRQRQVEKVILLGHSQGGHAVLSAQALAKSYGLAGQLVGVAAMAPFWGPARLLGVVGAPAQPGEPANPLEADPLVRSFIIEYFYTHAEVLDGAGQGDLLFKDNLLQPLHKHIDQCKFKPKRELCQFINPLRERMGVASEFFEKEFFDAVSFCGYDKQLCDASRLSMKWNQRFEADRPKLDPSGAPVVLWHGLADAVIFPPFAACAYDKITEDFMGTNASFRFCGDASNHDQIMSANLAWITSWIEALALGGPEPTPELCGSFAAFAAASGPCPEPPFPNNLD